MFDELVAHTTGTHGAAAVDAWTRVESAACARRLAAMVAMLDAALAADGSADRDQWCIDNWSAVCAHIGAAQRLTSGAASGLLLVGTALRDRFPKVGAVFTAGLIDYRLARTIVYRAVNVTDPDALRPLDAAMARALRTWEPMSAFKTEHAIDAFIARFDPDAVRRTQIKARGRSVDVVIDEGSGLATLFGSLFAPDATALDTRLNALAYTVCPNDPRTRDQRRADATGALAHGADRLACLCDTQDCPAALTPPSSGVVIHLVAHHDTITAPGSPERPEPDAPRPPDSPPGPDDPPVIEPDSGPTESQSQPTTHHSDGDAAADECAGLDGTEPPMFTTPLREMTLTEVITACNRDTATGQPSSIRPAAMMGGPLLPGAILRRAALNATIATIVHPGHTPPEPHYRPSKKLADFVRCRDQTCRYPACRVPATNCDLDHTITWPNGPTQASNLKALCRKHHLLKTFWVGDGGWRDRQLPNGNVIWTTPDGREHLTTPGSRLLFPQLCEPTAPITSGVGDDRPTHTPGLTMPRRQHTRAQDRTYRINHERELNRNAAILEVANDARNARAARRAKQALPEQIPPF